MRPPQTTAGAPGAWAPRRWRLAPARRPSRPAAPDELLEVVTPRTNAAALTPTENFLASVALEAPLSLEIAATARQRWFLARAGGGAPAAALRDQLAVAYPQADLRPLDTAAAPGRDPARRMPGERVAACALVLRGPPYLPLRTFAEPDVAADRARHAAQADPVLGLLGALGALPEGWRALAQLVLRPAPDGWARPYVRLAVEHPLAAERTAASHGGAGASLAGVLAPAALIGAGALTLHARRLWASGRWTELALLAAAVAGVAAVLFLLLWLLRRLTARPVYDPRLVAQKLAPPAFAVQLRLAVFAPAATPEGDVGARLRALAAAYRQFDLAAGNGLRPRPLRLPPDDPAPLAALRPLRGAPPVVLNAREVAGLWHLPQQGADSPLVERTAARQRLPLPADVDPARGGCRVGSGEHQGRSVPVALPDDLLRRHLLLVAKTRRGKSSLLARLAQHLMAAPAPGEAPPALVLVDPHRDLARAVLGLVPPERHAGVVALSLADAGRPFGLNLLDVGLGWDRDKAVSNALLVFRREFEAFWGPRMEDAFRFALLTLYEANQALCRDDPLRGRERQHTVLQVPAVLGNPAWRERVLPAVRDPVVLGWWTGYFQRLDRRLQTEVLNPVATKVQRFAGSLAARHVVGQARSTLDPRAWVREGAVVVLDAAKGVVGEDTAALVGATLLNLVALAVGEQAALPPRERRRVCLVVDEFHTLPGADYEALLSELAKYGASLVLATQSLARLEALDRQHRRALRPTVFANLDGLFAFHCSAEDARYLVRELGSAVDEEDLLELGEHRCYARLSAGGGRLPLFSLRLDPPPVGDEALADRLAAASAARYGRDVAAVEAEVAEALARIAAARPAPRRPADGAGPSGDGGASGATGEAHDTGGDALPDPAPTARGGRGDGSTAAGQRTGKEEASAGPPADRPRNDHRPGRAHGAPGARPDPSRAAGAAGHEPSRPPTEEPRDAAGPGAAVSDRAEEAEAWPDDAGDVVDGANADDGGDGRGPERGAP